MTFCDPILVAGPTRCGTTMLVGLIHFHGAWVGEAKITKHPETNPLFGSENINLKAVLKGNPATPGELRRRMLRFVYTTGPWVVKTAQLLLKHDLVIKAFPEARWLLPHRPIEDIVSSALRHPGMDNNPANRRRIAKQHLSLQDEVEKKAQYTLRVDVGRIATGDMTLARQVVGFCGLEFDEKTAADWIQPERWHGL